MLWSVASRSGWGKERNSGCLSEKGAWESGGAGVKLVAVTSECRDWDRQVGTQAEGSKGLGTKGGGVAGREGVAGRGGWQEGGGGGGCFHPRRRDATRGGTPVESGKRKAESGERRREAQGGRWSHCPSDSSEALWSPLSRPLFHFPPLLGGPCLEQGSENVRPHVRSGRSSGYVGSPLGSTRHATVRPQWSHRRRTDTRQALRLGFGGTSAAVCEEETVKSESVSREVESHTYCAVSDSSRTHSRTKCVESVELWAFRAHN